MENKKMGRPTNNLRDKSLHIRLSQKEIDDIQECADKLGVKRVEAVIEGIRLLKEKLN